MHKSYLSAEDFQVIKPVCLFRPVIPGDGVYVIIMFKCKPILTTSVSRHSWFFWDFLMRLSAKYLSPGETDAPLWC
ncbi:hypothetical protein, partial [Klebsiella pneumoniae]|uniref:hypothetical protein n=1 Tax=Klebsiella pneumoniae TaxID=573 RepID=UPI003B5B6487